MEIGRGVVEAEVGTSSVFFVLESDDQIGITRRSYTSKCPLGMLRARHLFSISEQLLRRIVKGFRRGLTLKAQRPLYHSTLGSIVVKNKQTARNLLYLSHSHPRGPVGWGVGKGECKLTLVDS